MLRARLRRGPSAAIGQRDRIAKGRFAKRKARELLAAARTEPRVPLKISQMLATFRRSPILDGLLPERRERWLPILARSRFGEIEDFDFEKFSLLKNPNDTLAQFRSLAELETRALNARINFHDEYVEDIGSYLVLSEVWPVLRHMARGGSMNAPVQRVLAKMNVGQDLKVNFNAVKGSEADLRDIWTMPVQRRHALRQARSDEAFLRPQKLEVAIDHFAALVDEWLGIDQFDMELTEEGRSKLKRIFGELLDNAERHSVAESRDGDWTMAAFMARRWNDEKQEYQYICRVAVMSIGQSIANSFDGAHPRIREAAENYAKKHRSRRRSQSAETLMTLFALQDMVTTDPEAFGSGGTGMMFVLDFFSELGGTEDILIDPRLTIVSGRSCIMLRRPHIKGERRPAENGKVQPRLLWCNESNSYDERPDPEFVFDLENEFRGTLVTMAFTLDLAYLRQSLRDENNGE